MGKIQEVSSICIENKDDKPQWGKVNKILSTLNENYNFYITSDEFNNIFINFEPKQAREWGSERYMWVSDDEENNILNQREVEDEPRATC